VTVVGAGMVGLATAWFLQERGVEVTILDRTGVAAGSSWGNAGWLTPGITTPLPEPAVLSYGIRAVLSPSSPVYVPPSANPSLLRFLLGFARHSTAAAWQRAMAALVPINRIALASFDELTAGGVAAPTHEAKSFTAAYRTEAERRVLLEEIEQIHAAGQPMSYDVLTGDQARAIEPALSEEIGAALVLHDQRYVNPGQFVQALADSVVDRGGHLMAPAEVTGVDDLGAKVEVTTTEHGVITSDAVVLATGAWLGTLARRFGVRKIVQAGRGYSFSVPVKDLPHGPVYFPAARVACTPLTGDQVGSSPASAGSRGVVPPSGLGDRLRVAGMMEFRRPEAPLDERRIAAIVDAARPLLRGADLDHRSEEWVGSRPCTADGLPLVGVTRSPHVYVAGGHGMWGITLGPATGQSLAEQIVTGRAPEAVRAFDPLR